MQGLHSHWAGVEITDEGRQYLGGAPLSTELTDNAKPGG